MDASQWLEHAVSLVFGGAGGIAAGLAKLTASLSAINKRQDALDKRQDALERRMDVLAQQKKEHTRQIEEIRTQQESQFNSFRHNHERQMDELRKQLVAQVDMSHSVISDKIDELRKDMGSMRSASVDQQIELQRSLGEVEGTLKMLARNGCARACERGSSPDFSSEPPTNKAGRLR